MIINVDLGFQKHTSFISKTDFYHLRNTFKVRPILSISDSEKLLRAFISSRLDYCNALLPGVTEQALYKLQLIQNAAAALLTRTKRCEHITLISPALHWLQWGKGLILKNHLLFLKLPCGVLLLCCVFFFLFKYCNKTTAATFCIDKSRPGSLDDPSPPVCSS